MPNNEIDQEILEKLMREDPAFMYRIDVIKDKMILNLSDYTDSIGSFGDLVGLNDTKAPSIFNNIVSSLGTIGEKMKAIEIPDINELLDSGTDNDLMNKLGSIGQNSESTFEPVIPNVVISDMSDKVYSTLDSGSDNNEGVFEQDVQNVVISDMSKKVYNKLGKKGFDIGSLHGSIMGMIGSLFGLKKLKGGFSGMGRLIKGFVMRKLLGGVGLGLGLTGLANMGLGAIALAAMVIPAVNAYKGYLKSKAEGGKDMIPNIVAQVLTGAGSMAGFAMAGATAGLTFGPVGMVIGGFLGAGMGALFDQLGHETVKKEVKAIWDSPLWRTIMSVGTFAGTGLVIGGPVGALVGGIIGAALSTISLLISEEDRSKLAKYFSNKKSQRAYSDIRTVSDSEDKSGVEIQHQLDQFNIGTDGVNKSVLKALKKRGIDIMNDDVMFAIAEWKKANHNIDILEDGTLHLPNLLRHIQNIERENKANKKGGWLEGRITEYNTARNKPVEVIDVSGTAYMDKDTTKEERKQILELLEANKTTTVNTNTTLDNFNKAITDALYKLPDMLAANQSGGDFQFDFSEMREATVDEAYNHRIQYHRGRL